MAAPGANNNDQLREAKDLLQQLNTLKRQLGEQPLNLGEDALLQTSKDLPNDIRRARKELEDMQGTASDLYSRLRGVTSEFKYQATTLGKVRGAFRQLEDAAQNLKNDEQGISDLNTSQLKKLQEKIKKSKELIRQEADSLMNSNRLAKYLEQEVQRKKQAGESEDQINQYILNRLGNIQTLSSEEKALLQLHFDQRDAVSEINDKILERIEQEKQVNKLLGVGGAVVGGISSLMGKLGMNSGIFRDAVSEAEEAMRETAKNIEAGTQSGGRLTVLMAGLKPLAKGFAAALLDPATIILAIVDGFLAVNAAAVDYTRLTGQSAVSTAGMNSSFASSVDVLKVMTELTKEIGMASGAIFSNADLGRLAEAKNLLGLSDKQAGNLGIRSKVAGKNIQEYEKGIVGATNKYNATNRAVIAHGAVLQEVLSTSDSISLSLGGNPEKITAAAAAAMSLGLNLQRVDEIAGSLTDFQSSISNELEAELLTGKHLNLEKAREYALSNDLAGVSKELAKNGASAAEFGKMNRLQQEALAKALGMSREELAKSAQLELLKAGASKEAIEAAGDMSLAQLEQVDIQNRIKTSLDKLAQSFAPILEALVPIVELLGNIIQPIAYTIAMLTGNPIGKAILLAVVAAALLGKSVFGVGKAFGSMFSMGKQALTGLTGLFKGGGLSTALGGLKDKLAGGFGVGTGDMVKSKSGKMFSKDSPQGKMITNLSGTTDKAGDLANKASTATETSDKAATGTKGGIKQGLKDLAGGLKAMGAKGVLQGIVNLALAGPALVVAVASIPFLLTIAAIGIPAGAGLKGLASGLKALGKAGAGALEGIGILALFGVALIPFTYALSLLSPLIESFGKAIKSTFEGIGALIQSAANGFVTLMGAVTMENIGPMLLLGPALFGIAAGLAAIAIAGPLAIPALIAVTGLAAVVGGVATIFGAGESKSAGEAKGKGEEGSLAAVEKKLDELISAVKAGGNVYMDSNKVGRAQILGSYKSA